MRPLLAAAFLAVLVLFPGCARDTSEEEPRSQMTERQRDSALAESGLPGASAVGRALAISDTAAARASRGNPESP